MSHSSASTTLTDFHLSRGAVMTESGDAVAHFGFVEKERVAFSTSAALLDGSSRTRLLHEGSDALDLLHRISTGDLLAMQPGDARFTIVTSERGRIVDVLNVGCVGDGKLLLLSDGKDPVAALEWIDKYTIIEDSALRDASDEFVRFVLIGPQATAIAESAIGVTVRHGKLDSVDDDEIVLVGSKWGGVDRIDLLARQGRAEGCWSTLAEAGAIPSGDEAFEAARIDNGIPLPGVELNLDANPLEAGLKDLVSFSKGCYIGQEVVARIDTYDRLQRRLVMLEAEEAIQPGAALTSEGKRAGVVTSVSPLPSDMGLKALGFARKEYWHTGAVLTCAGVTVTVRELPERVPFT